ncbi:MAG: tetratricopeptide repeat protein, partial [Planctomycetota bacterium]
MELLFATSPCGGSIRGKDGTPIEDPDQDYLVDGITDQIIAGLSKIPYMFTIAKESSFSYKGKAVEVRKVSEDLGVQYVLEGSVQRSGNRIRITVQLIDALSGRHMWSKRYDRELKDIFELQDDIMVNIMQAMQLKIAGLGILENKPTPSSVEAYFKILKALELVYRWTKEDNAQGRKLYEEAIELDPEYASTYRLLGWTHLHDVNNGWSEDPGKSLEKAEELANKAFSLGDDGVYHLLASRYLKKGQPIKAIAIGEKGLAINPNWANYLAVFAPILSSVGRYEEAIVLIKKAIRLNPHHPPWYLWFAGEVFWDAKRYDEAVPVFKKYIELTNDIWGYLFLIDVYIHLNREKEAQQIANEVVKKYPDFSIEKYVEPAGFDKQEDKRIIIKSLHKVGLPEHPPLKLPDKPSIAVLAFENLSGDPEQGYFSDGLTESIITGLSKTPRLFVIARNSTFTYKGKPTKVQKVGRELGVRYVLEGSVQKSKDRVRITAQLVDAQTGHHLWAERYDKELKNIFALQDEITFNVIAALQVKLTEGEQALIAAWGTDNFEAYAKFLKGQEYVRRFNGEGNLLARKMAEEVIALDPGYPRGYGLLGRTHVMDVWLRLTKSPRKSLAEAVRLFQKTITMHPSAADT